MERGVVLLLLAGIALSGCFSTGGDAPPTPAVTASSSTSTAPALPSVAKTTDTLHLLAPPDSTPAAPASSDDIAVELDAPISTGSTSNHFLATWSIVLPTDLDVLVANATFWVDVEGVVTGDPSQGTNGCFWDGDFHLHGAPATQTVVNACGTEPLQVPTGLRPVKLQFSATNGPFAKGTTFDFQFGTSASAEAPGAKIRLLTGSVDHDSQVTIENLHVSLGLPSLGGVLGHGGR